MELNISAVSYEGKWVDFGEARVKVRPYPASKLNFAMRDGAMILAGEQSADRFAYCLEAWEGFVDAAGKPIPLTTETKRKLYDFRIPAVIMDGKETVLADFVVATADEMLAAIRGAEKNS